MAAAAGRKMGGQNDVIRRWENVLIFCCSTRKLQLMIMSILKSLEEGFLALTTHTTNIRW